MISSRVDEHFKYQETHRYIKLRLDVFLTRMIEEREEVPPRVLFRTIQVKMPLSLHNTRFPARAIGYYYWLAIVRLSTISLDDISTSRWTMAPETHSVYFWLKLNITWSRNDRVTIFN